MHKHENLIVMLYVCETCWSSRGSWSTFIDIYNFLNSKTPLKTYQLFNDLKSTFRFKQNTSSIISMFRENIRNHLDLVET